MWKGSCLPNAVANPDGLGCVPAARTVVRLMTVERNNLTMAQTMTVAALEEKLPDLVEARDVVESFHDMLCNKAKDDWEGWIMHEFLTAGESEMR